MLNPKLRLATVALGAAMLAACSSGGDGGSAPNPPPTALPFLSCVPTPSVANSEDCTLFGTIDRDFTLTATNPENGRTRRWFIEGIVRVGTGNNQLTNAQQVAAAKANGVTLTIPAGTIIRGLPDESTLVITRGSKIMARGTRENPITFKSSTTADDDFGGIGLWGGLIVQGFAQQFGKGGTGSCAGAAGNQFCNIRGEGPNAVGFFGGNDDADNSGVIEFVRIAQGGAVTSANNEVNGLTLMGVGHGTKIEFVQIHNNRDDALEWFGGTVNVKYAVLTGNDDDEIDYDEGYRGNIQYVIAIRSQTRLDPIGGNDQRSLEANTGGGDFVPETNATISNYLMVGGPVVNDRRRDGETDAQFNLRRQPAILFRGAVESTLANSAAIGYDNRGCVQIANAPDGPGERTSRVRLTNVLGDCGRNLETPSFYEGSLRPVAGGEINAGRVPGLRLDAACALTNPEAIVPSNTPTAVANGSSFMFEATDFVGAVRPGTSAANAWWAGWTIPGTVNCAALTPAP